MRDRFLLELPLQLAVLLALATLAPAAAQEAASGTGWGGSLEVRPTKPPAPPAVKLPPTVRKPVAAERSAATSGRLPAPAAGRPQSQTSLNIVSSFAITGDSQHTVLTFDLVGPAAVLAHVIADPDRVILDLPEMVFQLPPGTGATGHGLVASFRFGLIEPGKSRIVLDTRGPVRIERAEVGLAQASATFQLEIELVAISPAEQAAAAIADAAHSFKPSIPSEPELKPRLGQSLRPVIVVDPGHGGIDPGTTGGRGVEKALVLDVALALRQALVATRRYEVVMTRVTDVFVALDERVRLSRHHQADLFVSIHADSLAAREGARNVRGATVYTLAEQASDDAAHRLAEKENAVDLLAGLPMQAVGDDQVRSILIDLMRRESLNFSNDFRHVLVGALKPSVLLSKAPQRSGPFKVLRQPGTAAVLVELGYMSNTQDEAIMLTPDWQAKVARAIAAAVDGHFAQRRAGRP